MSIARHHAEWLSLLEISGPFLSLPVLMRVFPTGVDPHEPELSQRVRSAYGEWLESQREVAIHRAWVEFVLGEVLELPGEVLRSGQTLPPGLQVTIAQQQETLRPDWAVVEPDAPHLPRLLVQVVEPGQGLEKPLKGSKWSASPATRMMELLHATGGRLGLVTNGEQWLLVNAPKGETTGFISWYGTLWLEEPLTLRSFRSLLGVGRFFSVAADETLEALLAESATDQQEVTDQLGYQVRQAVEVLVGAIAKLERDGVVEFAAAEVSQEAVLYEAVLTVMMRLVFLFCAEERGLIPSVGTEFYQANYAVATLREELRRYADRHGEEILERRSDAWCRLLATFRAVYAGVDHDVLFLPAYGGSLFDPDRFPFLEGRRAGSDWQVDFGEPLAVNNRVVLHLLEALQLLQIRVPGGGVETRRMSFRALDIEQIGHVYEGLLDHTAVRSQTPVLGLKGTKYEEPEIELAMLEEWVGKPEKDCLKWLKEQTGRSESALKKDLAVKLDGKALPELFLARLMTVCENDRDLYDRILPFVGLLRVDTLGCPVVIGSGMAYVTTGTDRRSTGTHYTPRSLTEEIVQYTLEPLVYVGPGEGWPREEWRLRSAVELLRLKVCDIAMGSGAFLVQVCRYLAERLVEAWGTEKVEGKDLRVLPDGSLAIGDIGEELLPVEAAERLLVARRLVADRCLYGVDKNPLAVEMAKLSLWLITLAKGRPFTFVDHALKCGDSLLGLTRAEQIEFLHLNPDNEAVQLEAASGTWRPILQDAIAKRKKLEGFSVNGIGDLQEKERLFGEAEVAIERLRFVGDYLISRALADAGKTADLTAEELMVVSDRIKQELQRGALEEESLEIKALRSSTERMMNLGNPAGNAPRKPFHWLLEFPEVFLEGEGFAAIVGNPPFQGGLKLFTSLGGDYRDFLVEGLAKGIRGNRGTADLCAYFFLRSSSLLQKEGVFGLIATNTISQGDTREVGLDQLVISGYTIPRAVPNRSWPGAAALEVAHVWLFMGMWKGDCFIDSLVTEGITPFLSAPGKVLGKPYALIANRSKSFQGSNVVGMGFVLDQEEAETLIQKNPKNRDVLFPYLNGQDLNSSPNQSPSRWVINFFDWSLDSEHDDPKNPKGAPYANDYPDCIKIVEERVKPQRIELPPINHFNKGAAKYWWRYGGPRIELYRAIEGRDRVLVAARVSKLLMFCFVLSEQVYSEQLVIIALQGYSALTIVQSSIFVFWAWEYCSTMRDAGIRFSPTDGFETFPFPKNLTALEPIGETYYTHRQSIMQTHQQGLTKTYNRFHNPDETAPDITHLRQLHIQMDQAVAAAYGWADLPLDHGFHPTKQGIRFTISEPARREVLDRLLQLNHERYAEEVAQGLHDKKKKGKGKQAAKKTPRKAKAVAPDEPAEIQGNLF
jgi:hypothetical protein